MSSGSSVHRLGDALRKGGAVTGEFMIKHSGVDLITSMSHSIHQQVSSQFNEESLVDATQNQKGSVVFALISDMLMGPHLTGTVLLTLVHTSQHFHHISHFSWTNNLTLVTLPILDSRLASHQQIVEAVLHVASFHINSLFSACQFEGSVAERVTDIIVHSILIAHTLLFVCDIVTLDIAEVFHTAADKGAAQLDD